MILLLMDFETFDQNFFISVFPPQGLNLNTPPWKVFPDRRGVAKTNKCKSQKHKRRDHLGNCKRRPHRENKRKHKEKRKQTMNKSKRKGKARSGRALGSSTSSLPPNKLNRSNILICPIVQQRRKTATQFSLDVLSEGSWLHRQASLWGDSSLRYWAPE